MKTICGIDCSTCFKKDSCKGCFETKGHPLGGNCVAAECCHEKGKELCSECCQGECERKVQLLKEVNALGIKDMPEVTQMYELAGCVVNIDYALPNKHTTKFWQDHDIYWGIQLQKQGSNRYYGITADDANILISEYDEGGSNPEIILYKKRN